MNANSNRDGICTVRIDPTRPPCSLLILRYLRSSASIRGSLTSSFFSLSTFAAILLLLSPGIFRNARAQEKPADRRPRVTSPDSTAKKQHETFTLRGRVVWLADALQRLHGVRSVAEAAKRTLVLETSGGKIYPLVEDVRGRAFRRDQRLRKMDLELLVRRHRGSPVVQVIRVYRLHKGPLQKETKAEVDYWCDICAIAMQELKPCDCCQQPIRLRERIVKKTKTTRDAVGTETKPNRRK